MDVFLKSVAKDLLDRQGNDLARTAIVFNNKRPVAYMQQHLAALIGRPFWSPAFFTVQELFALSSSLLVADPYTQFFTLYDCYAKLVAEEGGKVTGPDGFYGVAQTILADFAQIDMELVVPAQVFSELGDIAAIEQQFQYLSAEQQEFLSGFWASFSPLKQQAQQEQFIRMWRRMTRLYDNFHARLLENGLTTMGQLYRALAAGTADKAGFIDQYEKVAFVGFNALSKAETSVFKRWQQEGKALFYFDADRYYMADPLQEAGFFLRKSIGAGGLGNACGPETDLIRSARKTIRVYKTRGKTAQAKLLDKLLPEYYALLKQPDHTGRIAVILADEQLLIPVLQTIPADFPGESLALPVNVTMGFPLSATGVFGLASLWLDVQEQLIKEQKQTVYHRDAEAFLSHPLAAVDEKLRKDIQQQVLAGQLIEIPIDLLRAAGELEALFFAPMGEGTNGVNCLYAVFEYTLSLQMADRKVLKLEGSFLSAVMRELNRLHDVLFAYASQLPPLLLLSLIRKALQAVSVPLLGEPLVGLQVMGLLESRSLDFQHVFLLGACVYISEKLTTQFRGKLTT